MTEASSPCRPGSATDHARGESRKARTPGTESETGAPTGPGTSDRADWSCTTLPSPDRKARASRSVTLARGPPAGSLIVEVLQRVEGGRALLPRHLRQGPLVLQHRV